MSKIGKRLLYFRKKKKLTLRDVENVTGVKFGIIAAYERGDRNPPLKTIKRLAKAYEVSLIHILFSKEEIAESFLGELQDNAKLLLENPEINDLVTMLKKLPDDTMRLVVDCIRALILSKI